MKILRRNTIRVFSVAVVLLGMLLSGCEAQSEDVAIEKAHSDKKDIGPALSQFQPLDGFAQSLEPLSLEQCFGEKHSKQAVLKLLDEMYPNEDYPISGLGVLLGADTRSIASKNKEFRYVFNSPIEEDEQIKEAVLSYLQELLDLVGFKLREYPIEETAQLPPDLASAFDFPALMIENPGITKEELDKYEAYFMRYAHLFYDYKNIELSKTHKEFSVYLSNFSKKN